MKRKQGDMWSSYDEADLFLVTTNSTLRSDGALVMGRGIALEATRRFPNLQARAGAAIARAGAVSGFYGVLQPYPAHRAEHKLGLFQVKYHWRDKAGLDLIERSAEMLCQLVEETGLQNVHLNFPGIGNGHLPLHQVLPIVEQLPDAVTVWTK